MKKNPWVSFESKAFCATFVALLLILLMLVTTGCQYTINFNLGEEATSSTSLNKTPDIDATIPLTP